MTITLCVKKERKMQTQKEYILSAIVESAKKEFLENGYRNTSLRTIAKNSGVTLSNIYNYFSDKDALFCFLFKPVFDEVKDAMKYMEDLEASEQLHNEIAHLNMLDVLIEFINRNRDLLKCLLFNAEGSSLYGSQDKILLWFADLMENTFERITKEIHQQNEKPTELFFHLLGSLWVHLLEDTLKRDLSAEDIKINAQEVMKFVYHGWVGLLVKP